MATNEPGRGSSKGWSPFPKELKQEFGRAVSAARHAATPGALWGENICAAGP
jgi:hypothetical protein